MIIPNNILRGGNKGSIYLNGNCSIYTAPTTLVSITNSISISFWAKFDPTTNRSFVSTGNQSAGDLGFIWCFYQVLNDSIVYQVANGTRRTNVSASMVNYDKSSWNHYVIVSNYETNRTNIYINGIYRGGATVIDAIFPNRSNIILIGRYNITHSFLPNSNLSDVRIYGRELTVNEIKLMYKGVNISNNALLGRWELNEMDGFTAFDSSGNNLHGTITALGTWATDKPY